MGDQVNVLSEEERLAVATVRKFVDDEVRPVVRELEHANEYPEKLIDKMKELGVFGTAIPAEYGGTPGSTACYVHITQQLARGWMSLAGAVGGHSVVAKLILRFGTEEQRQRLLAKMGGGGARAAVGRTQPRGGAGVVAKLILRFGTEEQRQRLLPKMATGETRAAMALTEPGGGSDLQSMRTTAVLEAGQYVVNGSKTWITNGRRAGVIALLCKTDQNAVPRHAGISILL